MIEIVTMGKEHLTACAAIVDALDLFRQYQLSGAAAARLLERAMVGEAADLRVAVDEQGVLGFAWFVPRGAFDRSGYLRLIAVDPSRRVGAGRRLLQALEADHLAAAGIVLLSTSTNEGAHRFYEGLGYRRVGLLPGYVRLDLDEVIFYKPPGGG
jgi:ribosomal protein S18 acetylase RimI-like enzyme